MNIKSVCVLLTSVMLMTGCVKRPDTKSRAAAQPQNKTIAFLIRNTEEPFLQEYARHIVTEAAERKINLQIMDAFGDKTTQLDQLDALLVQGVTNYVIIAQDTSLTDTIAKKIAAVNGCACFANIPPTISALKKSGRFYYASSPEIACGRIQADLLNEYFIANPK